MKKNILLLFAATLMSCTVMAQDIKMRQESEIKVEVSYRMDQLRDYPNQWRDSEWREEYTMMLEVGNNQAHCYVAEERKTVMSALSSYQQKNRWHLAIEPHALIGETFINGKALEQIVDLDVAGVFRYTEDAPKLKWKITDERKTVLDYDCKRATCSFRGREYEAWFTEEIPLSYGPWKLGGLPGLILEVADTKNEYHFMATGIEKPKETKCIQLIDEPSIQPITREKALRTEAMIHKDHGAFAADYGIKFSLEGLEHQAMPYYPIELK